MISTGRYVLRRYVMILSVVVPFELSQETFPSLDFFLVCIFSCTCCHEMYVLVLDLISVSTNYHRFQKRRKILVHMIA
jgi:hypothetical protein